MLSACRSIVMFERLTDDKILALSNLVGFADDNFSVAKIEAMSPD